MEIDQNNQIEQQSIISNNRPRLTASVGPKSALPAFLRPENNGDKEDDYDPENIAFVAQVGVACIKDK